MKKTLTLFAALTGLSLQAQFTFNQSYFFQPGDNQYYSAGDTTGFDPLTAGTGLTWNYTSMAPSSPALTITYVNSPSSFPTADVMYTDNVTDYKVYENGADSALMLADKPITGDTIRYSNPAKVFDYPFNIASFYTDSLRGTYTSTLGVVTRTGTVTVAYDADGSMTTPAGTYANVYRVRRTYAMKDSVFSIIFGPVLSYYYFDYYEWYDGSSRMPVMIYKYQMATIGASAPTKDKKVYYKDIGTLIPEPVSTVGITAFPNPTTDMLYLNGTASNTPVYVTIMDISGKKLMENVDARPGVNVASLQSGSYLMLVNDNGQMYLSQFVKE